MLVRLVVRGRTGKVRTVAAMNATELPTETGHDIVEQQVLCLFPTPGDLQRVASHLPDMLADFEQYTALLDQTLTEIDQTNTFPLVVPVWADHFEDWARESNLPLGEPDTFGEFVSHLVTIRCALPWQPGNRTEDLLGVTHRLADLEDDAAEIVEQVREESGENLETDLANAEQLVMVAARSAQIGTHLVTIHAAASSDEDDEPYVFDLPVHTEMSEDDEDLMVFYMDPDVFGVAVHTAATALRHGGALVIRTAIEGTGTAIARGWVINDGVWPLPGDNLSRTQWLPTSLGEFAGPEELTFVEADDIAPLLTTPAAS